MRNNKDNYYTPLSSVQNVTALLDMCLTDEPKTVLEPAAGDGRIVCAVGNLFPCASLYAIDKTEPTQKQKGVHWYTGDFLTDQLPFVVPKFDLIITNPPFSTAQRYLARCLDLLTPNGHLFLLLRLGFLASKIRWNTTWKTHTNRPNDLYVLSARPSFDGVSTDHTDYMWAHWVNDGKTHTPVLSWINDYIGDTK